MVDKRRMGEILVELGLIDEYQLKHALDVAKREGLKLGEVIIRLGYLGEDQVLDILKNLTSIPILDMKDRMINTDSQIILPPDRMREMRAVPLDANHRAAVVAFADPLNYLTVEKVKFLINRDVDPVLATRFQIDDILDHLDRTGYGIKQIDLSAVRRSVSKITVKEMDPSLLIRLLDEPACTDLHLSIGTSPAVRCDGAFKRYNMPIITPGIMDEFLKEVLSDDRRLVLEEKKQVEFTYVKAGVGRYRMNIYRQKGGEVAVAAKKLVEDIPSVASLGIPETLTSLLDKRGLIVVSSARGQGKDTTIAALVDHINSTMSLNVITFENPIEYIHRHKMSNVNQRELGSDTCKDLADVFEHAMKHDPDVLVMSGINDKIMSETAVLAAQKGILVIVGMNAIDVFSAIEQMISTLSDDYMKALLSRSILSVFAQRLVWSKSSKKRILIWEQLLATPRVQKYIRDDKVYYIKGQATSRRGEYFPGEASLAKAIKNGSLSDEAIQSESWVNQDVLKTYLDR